MSQYKHILTDFKDLRKVIGEITKSQPAKTRYQQQAEKMGYRQEAEKKKKKKKWNEPLKGFPGNEGVDEADVEASSDDLDSGPDVKQAKADKFALFQQQKAEKIKKERKHAGWEEIQQAYMDLGDEAQGSVQYQKSLIQKQLAKMGYKTYSKMAFDEIFMQQTNSVTPRQGKNLDENFKENDIKKSIKAPFVTTNISTLGGKDRPSLAINISLDKESTWTNKIFMNSRHATFMLHSDKQSIELIRKHYKLPKFRKGKYKSDKDVITKINKWIDSAKSVKEEVELDELVMYSIKNTKTGKTYSAGHFPQSKSALAKIRKAGGVHKYAAMHKDGKVQKEEEEVEFDEARQLKNPKKEVLVVKSGKVIVISKRDAKKYLNNGWELAEEVEGIKENIENIEINEGGFKDIAISIDQGDSPQKIAKKYGLDLKYVRQIVKDYKKVMKHVDDLLAKTELRTAENDPGSSKYYDPKVDEGKYPSRSQQIKEEHDHAKQSPFKLKTQQYPRAVPIDTDGFGKRHATVEDIITACDAFGMIIDKELQVEQIQKTLGKKGFISYNKEDLVNVFHDRETERMILALESDLEEQEPTEYTQGEIAYAQLHEHDIEFLKPDGQKAVGPILKMGGNTYNVKDKYTGKSFTYKYSGKDTKIEEEKVKTFSEVSKPFDEGREKGPRQLTNPNKEVMVVKKNKVIVIDKKDRDKYLRQGWTLAEDIEEGKYLRYSDLLMAKARAVEKFGPSSPSVKALNREIEKEIKKLGIKEEINLKKIGQDLEKLAKTSKGGTDKNDMMKVAVMLKKGDKSGALKYAKNLDNDRRLKSFGISLTPQQYVLDLLGEEVYTTIEELTASERLARRKAKDQEKERQHQRDMEKARSSATTRDNLRKDKSNRKFDKDQAAREKNPSQLSHSDARRIGKPHPDPLSGPPQPYRPPGSKGGAFGKTPAQRKAAQKKKNLAVVKKVAKAPKKLAKKIFQKKTSEATGDEQAYKKFFNKALKKFGVSSPDELEGEKKKEFFNYVDKNWKADHEEVNIHKNYRVDGRRTNFREKMKKLGYIKSNNWN